MRELKFRAWQQSADDDNPSNDPGDYCGIMTEFKLGDRVPWTHKTIMQFTGLKDGLGNDIFEGDILQWPRVSGNNRVPVRAPVTWSDKECGWIVDTSWGDGHSRLCYILNFAEVVGNIYEDQQLLSTR